MNIVKTATDLEENSCCRYPIEFYSTNTGNAASNDSID